MVKRFRLCMLRKTSYKKKSTFVNLKCDICNDQTIRFISNFHICFVRV